MASLTVFDAAGSVIWLIVGFRLHRTDEKVLLLLLLLLEILELKGFRFVQVDYSLELPIGVLLNSAILKHLLNMLVYIILRRCFQFAVSISPGWRHKDLGIQFLFLGMEYRLVLADLLNH